MNISDLLGIIGVIVGIASLAFAMWTWMRARLEKHELLEFIRGIHAVAGTGILEATQSLTGAADKALGIMTSIRTLTARYSEHTPDTDLPDVMGRALWSVRMMLSFEVSPTIAEVWLVTPDLKPDSSDEEVGKIVHKNIMEGKSYIYFYPDDLPQKESELTRLQENIFLSNRANSEIIKKGVTLVPLDRAKHEKLFYRGNIILYFRDKNRIFPPRCFEEIVLTKISERGNFWQEHSESVATQIKHELDLELAR